MSREQSLMKSCGNSTTHEAGALGSGAHGKPGSRLWPALEAKARKRVFRAPGALVGAQQMGGHLLQLGQFDSRREQG